MHKYFLCQFCALYVAVRVVRDATAPDPSTVRKPPYQAMSLKDFLRQNRVEINDVDRIGKCRSSFRQHIEHISCIYLNMCLHC